VPAGLLGLTTLLRPPTAMASMVGSDSALREDDLDTPVLRFTHAHWRRHTWILPLNWLVIEIASVNDESIVTVRFRGRLSVSDLSVFETAPPIDMRGISIFACCSIGPGSKSGSPKPAIRRVGQTGALWLDPLSERP
jgi:hypothetical protein